MGGNHANPPTAQNLSQPPSAKKKCHWHKIPNPTTRKSHILNSRVPGSFNGRTGAFEASNPGSNPGPGANTPPNKHPKQKSPRQTPGPFLISSYDITPELNALVTLQLDLQASVRSHRPRSLNNPVSRLLLHQRRAFVSPLVVRVHFQRCSSHEHISRRRVDR